MLCFEYCLSRNYSKIFIFANYVSDINKCENETQKKKKKKEKLLLFTVAYH